MTSVLSEYDAEQDGRESYELACREIRQRKIAAGEIKFGAILVDPPWPNDNYTDKGVVPSRADQPYATMTLAEIAGLPLQSLMAKNCAVFLWTMDNLPEASAHLAWAWGRPGKPLRLIRSNQFVWVKTCKSDPDKPRNGMGRWTRGSAESVTVLAQGRPPLGKVPDQTIIDESRREHSRKPDEIYSRIEALVDGPYLEMFARQRWPGWDAWGNEIDKFSEVA
ncbi:MAG: MT-A70 family methyltransferase [Planctomycetota bacterium]